MKFKRWFTSLVCLILVFSFCLPMVAMAAPTLNLADYKVSSSTSNGITSDTYTYSDGHYHCINPVNSSYSPSYIYGTTANILYTVPETLKNCTFYVGFAPSVSLASSSTDAFLFGDVVNIPNYRKATIKMSVKVKSSVATTITTYMRCDEFDDAPSSYLGRTETTSQSVSLTAGVYKTIDYSMTWVQKSSLSIAFSPYVYIKFPALSADTSIVIDSYSFSVIVESGEELPVYPSFSKNLSTSTVTYLKNAEPAPLSVTASVSDGGTLSYAWFRNTEPNTSTGSLATEVSTASYTPPTSQVGTMYYYCVVTNTKNGKTSSSTSNVACVQVIDEPKGPQITQNLSTAILEYEKDVPASALMVSAITTDGGTLSYQWYSNTVDSTEGGTAIDGAAKSTYTPPTSQVGTVYYYCVLTNNLYGYTATTTSNVAGVRVVPPPDPALSPVITTNLSMEEVVYTQGDAAAALRIGASSPDGGVLSYQWYKQDDDEGALAVAIPGATLAVMTPETTEIGTAYYYCVVTNTLGKTSASTNSLKAMITVTKDNTETLLGSIIDGITGIWDSIKGMWESLKELPTKITEGLSGFFADLSEGLGNVVNSIVELPQRIMDGIKDLFIPDPEYMASYQEQWNTLLADHFGAVYESVVVINDFYSSFQDTAAKDVLTVPSVTIDLAGTPWTFGGWEVDLVPDGLQFFVDVGKRIISIICTLFFINALRNRFERLLGGGNA